MIEGNNPEINHKELAEKVKGLSAQTITSTIPKKVTNPSDMELRIILLKNRIKNLEEEITVKEKGIETLPPQLDMFPINTSFFLQRLTMKMVNHFTKDKLKPVKEEHQSLLKELGELKIINKTGSKVYTQTPSHNNS